MDTPNINAESAPAEDTGEGSNSATTMVRFGDLQDKGSFQDDDSVEAITIGTDHGLKSASTPTKETQEAGTEDTEESTGEESQTEEAGEAASKLINVKSGDEELSLSPETLVPVKIDGKIQELPLQEVINKASGEVAVETRFNKLNQEKKKFEQEKSIVNQYLESIIESANSGEASKVLNLTAQLCNQDPVEFESALTTAVLQKLQPLLNLDDEDVQTLEQHMSLDYYKNHKELVKEQRTVKQQKQQELAEERQKLQSEYGKLGYDVRDEVLSEAQAYLQSQEPGKQPTQQEVVQFVASYTDAMRAQQVVERVKPSLKDSPSELADAARDLMKAIKIAQGQGQIPTDEYLEAVARDVFGSDNVQKPEQVRESDDSTAKLAQKLQKASNRQSTVDPTQAKPLAQKRESAGQVVRFQDLL